MLRLVEILKTYFTQDKYIELFLDSSLRIVWFLFVTLAACLLISFVYAGLLDVLVYTLKFGDYTPGIFEEDPTGGVAELNLFVSFIAEAHRTQLPN